MCHVESTVCNKWFQRNHYTVEILTESTPAEGRKFAYLPYEALKWGTNKQGK
jgi:hypothetical protein